MSLPDYLDADLQPVIQLGSLGVATLTGGLVDAWPGGRLSVAVSLNAARVYDVWVARNGAWTQLQRDGEHWAHDDVPAGATCIRFWIAPMDPDTTPALSEAVVETAEVRPYLPVVEGEPPLPGRREVLPSRLMRWIHGAQQDVVVAAMLEEWTEAAAEAAALGWMCGLPRGEDLLLAYARSSGASDRVADHEPAFARWLVAELGQRIRGGLTERRDAESRRSAVELLVAALGRLLRAVSPGFRLDATPPAVIGPRERHRWLVDEPLAGALDNPSASEGAHQPVFVLRPLLLQGERVLLEGLVV